MTWIQTFTSRAVDLLAPTADQICLADIAHHLARVNRFTGATRDAYSVAEHCCRVSARVRELLGCGPLSDDDRSLVLAALLHDAHEAYLGDWSSPLIAALGSRYPQAKLAVVELRSDFDAAIAEWAGIRRAQLTHPLVKRADLELLETERRDLLGPPPRDWLPLPDPLEAHMGPCWSADYAEETFAQHYRVLRSGGAP